MEKIRKSSEILKAKRYNLIVKDTKGLGIIRNNNHINRVCVGQVERSIMKINIQRREKMNNTFARKPRHTRKV